MAEHPIVFSGVSVRAILAGRKTQTRRIVKHWQNRKLVPLVPGTRLLAREEWGLRDPGQHYHLFHRPVSADEEDGRGVLPSGNFGLLCPFGTPGDRLWVRESWGSGDGAYGEECDPPRAIAYRSDQSARQYGIGGSPDSWRKVPDYDIEQWNWSCIKWRSPVFMPHWASRLTLEVLSVRAERLQAITEEDAREEGVDRDRFRGTDDCWDPLNNRGREYRAAFEYAWGELHGWDGQARAKPGATWFSNPWVWVIEFKKVNNAR